MGAPSDSGSPPSSFPGLFLRSSQTSSPKRAISEAVQALRHLRLQQRKMTDGEKIFGDEPEWLIGGHPMEAVEARQVDGIGKRSERSFASQIEIHLEVAHRQFTKTSIDGLAIAASGVVGF